MGTLTFLNLIGLLNLVLTVAFLSSISLGLIFTSALGLAEELVISLCLGLALVLTLFLSKLGDDSGNNSSDEESSASFTLTCCLILNLCFIF